MYNWRWVFFMILPFTVVALSGAWAFVHDVAERSRARLDWTGLLALTVSLSCLQLMLDRGERLGWFESWEIIAYAVVCVTAFYIFIAHCMTTEAPFLPLGLLANRNYVVGLLTVLVFGMLNFTPMTLLPPLVCAKPPAIRC